MGSPSRRPWTPGDEALDLVHVEALVDPRGQQCLEGVGLGADLAALSANHGQRIDDQREHAERGLRERGAAARTPRAHADVGLDLEVLPAALRYRHRYRDRRSATARRR